MGNKWKWRVPLLCLICLLLNVAMAASSVHFNINCENGKLSDEGECKCDSCWTGDSCTERVSAEPRFDHGDYKVYLNDEHLTGTSLFTVKASDPDADTCTDDGDCPCSTIEYSIGGQNGEWNFWIKPTTGDIFTIKNFKPLEQIYKIEVVASDGDGHYTTVQLEIDTREPGVPRPPELLVVQKLESDDLDFKPLRRQKRSITLPSEVQFDLVKTGANENETSIKVGTRIEFKLDIVFPSGDTDIQIELFTPDTSTVVMMLCNVNLVKGDNLAISGNSTPALESRNNNKIFDRAVIALDVVTNNGGDLTTMTPSTLTVTYDAVMIENPSTVDNTQYWVSAGAEFNNSLDIWVGQAPFLALTADDTAAFTKEPQFNFTGPTELSIGSSSLFYLDVMLPYPIIDVKVDIFAAINISDAMSICSGKLMEVSESYECSMGALSTYEAQYFADGNSKTYGRVNWDLGRPINKKAREIDDVTIHKMSFGVVIKMEDNENLVGNDYVVGAAVEIGDKTIWAGQLSIRAAIKEASDNVSVTHSLSAVDGVAQISKSSPMEIQIDLELTEKSNADYRLEVEVPFIDNKAVLQLCTSTVLFVGVNLGCVDSSSITSEFKHTNESSAMPDIGVFNIGRVTNVGSWGWYTPEQETTKNKLRMSVMISAADHSAATEGSRHDVIVALYAGDRKLNIGSIELEIIASTPAAAISALTTPTFDMAYDSGSDIVKIGALSRLNVNITLARNTVYEPFDLEFIMPNSSDSSMLSVCQVQLLSVGRNIPCLVKEIAEKQTELVSSYVEGTPDRTTLYMPFLCNKEMVNDTSEDTFQISVVFKVLDNPGFKDNNKTWVSCGVRYSEMNIWVGQAALYADTSAPVLALTTPPHLAVVAANTSWPGIPHGYPGKYLVRIKTNTAESTLIGLNVSSTNNALSICNIRYVRSGNSYFCMLYEGTKASIDEEDASQGIIRKASFNLGLVQNQGATSMQAGSGYDSNTIELEVTVAMTADTAIAADGSTHNLDFTLVYDSPEKTLTSTASIKAVADTSFIEDTLSNAVTASSAMASISGTDEIMANESLSTIVLGESKRMIVEIDTEISSISEMTVTMTTPTDSNNLMSVEYIGLLDVGDNLPCVKAKNLKTTYTPRSGSLTPDIGELDFSYICNVGQDKSNETSNKIRVEGIIRLLPKAAINNGDALTFNVAVNVNNQSIAVLSHLLTVADANKYTDIYAPDVDVPNKVGILENTTVGTLNMSIGEIKVLPVVFTIPSYTSSYVMFDVMTPSNTSTSALITVNNVEISRTGRNVPDFQSSPDLFDKSMTSAFRTSQMTDSRIAMGVVTNPGIRQRLGDFTEDDDTFTAEFTLQLSDNNASKTDDIIELSFGYRVARFIFILEIPITVERLGSEALEFNISSSVDEVNSTSTDVYIDSIVALANSSTLEGKNSIFNVFYPPYVSFVSSEITSPFKEFIKVDDKDGVVTFEFGPLFFTDDIHMKTKLAANTSYKVPPGITGFDSVLTYQAVADTHFNSNLVSEMDYVNFTVTTVAKSGIDCVNGPLGMTSSTLIKDCQITAPRDHIIGYEPHKARYNSATAWTPFVHSGKVREERYLQVYFGNKSVVNSISLQQDGPAMATLISIRHSDDGLAWVEHPDNKITIDPGQSDQQVAIPSPQTSRFLRVMITEMNDNVQKGAFRMEFTGCHVTSDGPADICAAVTTTSPLSDFKSRSFLTVMNSVYVCDGRQGNMDIEQKCYFSSDGTMWQEVDPRVGSMLGYESDESRVYAVSSNGLHYISSKDGNAWETSVPDDVTNAKSLGTFKAAIEVPLNGDADLNLSDPHAKYTDGTFGATSVGVKKNTGIWNTCFEWGSCCDA